MGLLAAADECFLRRTLWRERAGHDRSAAKAFPGSLLEKLPLLALSAGSAIITMKAQWADRTLGGLNSYSLPGRLSNAIVDVCSISRPRHLAGAPVILLSACAELRGPRGSLPPALLLLLPITGLAFAARNRRYLAVGWLWFLGTLDSDDRADAGRQPGHGRSLWLPAVHGIVHRRLLGRGRLGGARGASPRSGCPPARLPSCRCWRSLTRRQLSYWTDDLTLWTHARRSRQQ